MNPAMVRRAVNRPLPELWVSASLGAFAIVGSLVTLLGWFTNIPQQPSEVRRLQTPAEH